MRPPVKSAVHGGVALAGLVALLLGMWILWYFRPFANPVESCLFLVAMVACTISAADLSWQRIYRRQSTGLDFALRDYSWSRTATKLIGLLGSFGFIGLLYWLFPEYHGSFYHNYYAMLEILLPVWFAAAIPYFFFVDSRMRMPRDGYWQLGRLLLCRWTEVDYLVLRRHILGWLIKGFFLPLMFVYMCNDLSGILAFNAHHLSPFRNFYDSGYAFIFFVDVTLATTGYIVTLRLTDTHIRSPEPTLLGWVAALVCYEPFWSLIGGQYLAYGSGRSWGGWFWDHPAVYVLWGSVILLLLCCYVSATVTFGCRFSNITHRGILTNGPYRFTKHPAYVAKNLSWWLISVPFLYSGTLGETVRNCLLLLGVNGIYFLRAKTEEWHLSRDPVYVQYAQWINDHGLFSRLSRLRPLGFLAYRLPVTSAYKRR